MIPYVKHTEFILNASGYLRLAARSPEAEMGEQSCAGLQLNFCPFSSWKLMFAELHVTERWETTEIRVAGIEILIFGV